MSLPHGRAHARTKVRLCVVVYQGRHIRDANSSAVAAWCGMAKTKRVTHTKGIVRSAMFRTCEKEQRDWCRRVLYEVAGATEAYQRRNKAWADGWYAFHGPMDGMRSCARRLGNLFTLNYASAISLERSSDV